MAYKKTEQTLTMSRKVLWYLAIDRYTSRGTDILDSSLLWHCTTEPNNGMKNISTILSFLYLQNSIILTIHEWKDMSAHGNCSEKKKKSLLEFTTYHCCCFECDGKQGIPPWPPQKGRQPKLLSSQSSGSSTVHLSPRPSLGSDQPVNST